MEMWFSEFHTPDVKHSIRVNRHLYSRQSEYQRIDIFEIIFDPDMRFHNTIVLIELMHLF